MSTLCNSKFKQADEYTTIHTVLILDLFEFKGRFLQGNSAKEQK